MNPQSQVAGSPDNPEELLCSFLVTPLMASLVA